MAQRSSWAHALRVRADRCVFVCALAATISLHPAIGAAQAVLGDGWQTTAVGSPALPGTATYTACPQPLLTCGNFLVTAGGRGIESTSDQFRFVYRPFTGDGVVIARVRSIENVSAWSKAGVMIRESLSPGSRHAFARVSAGKGVAFQRRRTTNGRSVNTAGPDVPAPRWLKLTRLGSTIRADVSSDGVNWIALGSDVIALPETVWIGVAVTSRYTSATTTAAIEQATVSPLLPTGWDATDIGSPSLQGAISFWNSTFSLNAAGADIWGSADQFSFAYQRVTGDVDITARVKNLQNVDPWSKAGVMVRDSLSAGAVHASVFLTPSNGVVFQRRLVDDLSSASTSGPGVTTPGWVKLERRADIVTALYSANGSLWTVLGSEVLPMPATLYVGLAVTSDDDTEYARAQFDNVTIQTVTLDSTSSPSAPPPTPTPAPTPPANAAPTVNFTAPTAGTPVTVGSEVTLAAIASDPDGTIARVDFYVGGLLVGSDTTAPYSTSWTPTGAGAYGLTAIAYDDTGGTGVSPALMVTVGTAPVALAPITLTFTPSATDAEVMYYFLRIYRATDDITIDSAVTVQNLGNPPIVNGTSSADVTTTILSLPAGSYVAVVSAVGAGGEAASAPSPPFTE